MYSEHSNNIQHLIFSCFYYSYNGIGSLVPLQLGRIPSLRALFLQGKAVLDLNGHVTAWDLL